MTIDEIIALLNQQRPACVETLNGKVVEYLPEKNQLSMQFEPGLNCCHSVNIVQGGYVTAMLDAAMAQGGVLDPLDGTSAARVDVWLNGAMPGGSATTEIRLRSGDPDDLTLRQARWLGAADLVAHEPGVAAEILSRARADAVRIELPVGVAPEPGPGLTVVIRRG